MRIVHLNPFYFPYAGGIERRIRELARRQARRHDVTVLTSQLDGTGREEHEEGVQILRLPSRYRFRRFYNPPLVSTPGLAQALAGLRPDVVDYHSRWAPSYARAFQSTRGRRVFTYHNTFGEGMGLLGALSRWNDRRANRYVATSHRVLAVSQAIRSDLVAHGVPESRIVVTPNGVDATALRSLAGDEPAGADRHLVSVGRVVRVKGFDLLVRALAALPSDVSLTICGDGPERAALQRLAERIGVGPRVQLPGWVPEAEKARLLRRCLAYVQPSRYEAFGMAALEALALGAPVVAARVGGLPEVVGSAGLLVQPENESALCGALQDVCSDPDPRARFGSSARAQVDRYSWDRVAEQAAAAYEEALAA